MTERTRQERTGVDFPDAAWTSFDRYDRYGVIARCLRATLGPGAHRVLDVGDAAGYLGLFAGDLRLTGLDVAVQPDRLPDAIALVGDGTRLPFADQTFDAVVSSDVLEHVRIRDRPTFIAELSRVSKDIVVVAAPFDTEGVAGVEELVRRFVLLATGKPQEQLEEHRERCLPSLAETAQHLAGHGSVVTVGNGNLWDWLQLMLVKHQLLARPALQPLHDGIDALYNLSLAGRASEPPYYRHMLAARRSGAVSLGQTSAARVPTETMAGILSSLGAAVSPEATRQDAEPPLDHLLADLKDLSQRVERIATDISGRLDALEEVQAEIVGPVRRMRSMARTLRLRRNPSDGGAG